MAIIDGVALLVTLLIGSAGGWLVAVASHNMAAERERSYEAEMADLQELYAAWASLRRVQADESQRSCRPD
jgi:hypothetical protein